jgi:hypothetical protein
MKKKYFDQQIEDANMRFLGADGWDNADGDWDNADGDEESFDGQDMLSATGNTTNESQPYIINVTNTTTNAVTDVEILSANIRQSSFAASGLSHSYGIPGVSYQLFLASIASGEMFNVGLTRLIATHPTSSSIASAQIAELVTLETLSINGNTAKKTFTPLLDSYQQIDNQVDLKWDYMVTGLVSFKIASLAGLTTIKVIMFPKSKINNFSAIEGKKNKVSTYSNPKVNPFQRALGGKR